MNELKRTLLILVIGLMMVSIPMSALGFFTPSVTNGHGAGCALIVSDGKFQIGGEYGLTNELAVSAALGEQIKIGLKYELDPSLALLAGIADSSPYIGVNGATSLNRDLSGIGEIDFTINDSKFNLLYNLGLKYNLPKNFDLRGGLLGDIGGGNSQLLFALGVGYKF